MFYSKTVRNICKINQSHKYKQVVFQIWGWYLEIGLGDISHAICMRISSVKPVPWLAVNSITCF